MGRINEIAAKHGVRVIEDCAQSGADSMANVWVLLESAAYYTFGLTKNITSLSGAMITTNDKSVAQFVRAEIAKGDYAPLQKSLKEAMTGVAMMVATLSEIYWATVHPAVVLGNKFGQDPITIDSVRLNGYDTLPSYYQTNGKARAIQAAVGMKQLDRIEALNSSRIVNGAYLDQHLDSVSNLGVPEYPEKSEPIYMSFVVHLVEMALQALQKSWG